MSTNINITVGDSGLLDRARQQQDASRQAQLNREAATQLEAQAIAARTTAFAAQGRDASGNLLTGGQFTQAQIDRRPAANRQGGARTCFVVWYDNEAARIFGPSSAVITITSSRGDYQTTEHLGQTAYAQPTGAEGDPFEETLFHEWSIEIPDELTNADFTIEAWMRSNDVLPSGGLGFCTFTFAWEGTGPVGTIAFSSTVQLADEAIEHQASFSSTYGDAIMSNEQPFGTTVQGWKHFCYQRISGVDVFHYHGIRAELTQVGDEPLPSPRPITPDATLRFLAESQTTSGTALGQIRTSFGRRYGFANFTPPATPFYVSPL
jgi:hypothetical protein